MAFNRRKKYVLVDVHKKNVNDHNLISLDISRLKKEEKVTPKIEELYNT